MKLLKKYKVPKKRLKQPNHKNGLFSYASYLYQRKTAPYKISYKAFMHYCLKAKYYLGKPSNNLLLLLEHRLDMALYRIRFCQSLEQARQLILHKQVIVNGQPMVLSSYHLKPGDVIEFKKTSNLNSADLALAIERLCNKKGHVSKRAILKKPKQKKYVLKMLVNNRRFKKRIQKRRNKKKQRPTFFVRPLHFEINFLTKTAIFLYPPQKLYFSQRLHSDLIRRSFKKTL